MSNSYIPSVTYKVISSMRNYVGGEGGGGAHLNQAMHVLGGGGMGEGCGVVYELGPL